MTHADLVGKVLAAAPTEYVAMFEHRALFDEYGYRRALINAPFTWAWYKQRLIAEAAPTLQMLLDLCGRRI